MPPERDIKAERQAGADAIAAKAVVLANESGVVITQCTWDIDEDLAHEHAHRLDLFADQKSVRLYFPDLELTGWQENGRRKRTEDKLKSAIAQLQSRPPAATYSFS